MPYSSFRTYFHLILSRVPWEHWVIMGGLSLALTVLLLIRKKCTVYGAICMGITLFAGLFLLETAVVIRYFGMLRHASGVDFRFDFLQIFQGTKQGRIETFSNIVIFVPFGFFLSEFLSSTKRFSPWRQLAFVALVGFGLSLCIECLQLFLRVGFFEVMDLVLNTVGAFVGAVLSALMEHILGLARRKRPL